MNEFLNLAKNRRSTYGISNEIKISDEKLKKIIEEAIHHTPSAFNSQSSRVVLLLGDDHKKLWDMTLTKLKEMIPENNFKDTADKIKSFEAGYGTLLYFEDQTVVKGLQSQFVQYADNFPIWSQQASGMLQFAVWSAFANEGIGASLQHYNPLVDEEIAATWNISSNWKLVAQMPFGNPIAPVGEKDFMPIEEKFKAFGHQSK